MNIFQHEDPARDNFALFETAGYGDVLRAMAIGDEMIWRSTPIPVEIRRNGKWWEIIRVEPGCVPDEPDEPSERSGGDSDIPFDVLADRRALDALKASSLEDEIDE